MKDLYLDCFSGVSGDMLVGALLDLGASLDGVREGLSKLGVGGWALERRTVRRHAIAATKFDVRLEGHPEHDPGAVDHGAAHAGRDSGDRHCGGAAQGERHCGGHDHGGHADHEHGHGHEHAHAHRHGHTHGHGHEHGHEHGHRDAPGHAHAPSRGLREIRALLAAADLPPRVKERALAAFTLLAEGEAKVHGTTADEVHFHEVGAVDAICDIVGAALALEALGVERVFCGPIRAGSGFVRCEHGTMPVPAPGAIECLRGFDVRFEQGRGELVTPTGACLVGALAEPHVPASFVVARVGYGAGTRDPEDAPNVLRAVLGNAGAPGAACVELATNLDHLAPVQVAAAMDAAFAAGAADAYVLPCTMKKGRPGHLLVALVPESARAAVETAIFRETGTLGIRRRPVERTVLARRHETVTTPWGAVRVKIGVHAGEETSRVPEYEDCRALAERAGVSVAAVLDAARRACEKSS